VFLILLRKEKTTNLVYEVASGVRFGHQLQIVNSGSPSCHMRAFWSLCDDVVYIFFANNPYMFVSSK
jgi:hypothetical protein